MDNYLVYVGVAIATILLPGPAVMLTINNSIQRGLFRSLAGVLGIAIAILLVAVISATSLGIILAGSVIAFTVVKIIGAAYLIYLGIKMWRTKEASGARSNLQEISFFKCFIEGFLVSISNPKAVIFFMSIFPQFIDLSQEYRPQFILLAVTFSVLVIVIHTAYALFSSFAKSKLSSSKGNGVLNKVSGGIFVGFGIGLAASSR
ncbi:LysE family translocator [Paraglaciecola sp.]|uniref:LysE family translocator n=1 Tax=Paraglaciecola sp. TaxID=1920173 RepID=UPI0030F3C51C